ncbi:MAG: ClbS/DfsB family four-helix bundle protein [Pseudomonadota bacterium]
MALKTKAELREITRKEFGILEKLIDRFGPVEAMQKLDDDTSVKDVIAHRAHWIDLFLGWYADGQAGKKVHFPAEGYKWNDLKRYNADVRNQQSDMTWPEAVAYLRRNYQALTTFIEGCSAKELYGGPMKGANNAWTTGRWAEAAGPSHFRSASKFLRSVLRASS